MRPNAHTRRRALAVALCLAAAAPATATVASAQTTAQRTLVPGTDFDAAKPGFLRLTTGPRWPVAVRELPSARAQGGRSKRRISRTYFAYLTDFQLADEESPARLESEVPTQPNSSSWRPQEALMPQTIDAELRRLSTFAPASPNAGAKGRRARMDLALLGGDQADNSQANEATWVRQLLEGGQVLNPNSGVSDYRSCTDRERAALAERPADEASRYTGIQDYTDYNGGAGDGRFYDPDRPAAAFAAWPRYAGLLDAAERPFAVSGLRNGAAPVPSYVTVGNHDAAVHGFFAATQVSQSLATGCSKPYRNQSVTSGEIFSASSAVPPDPQRRLVGPVESKKIFASGTQADAHGFGFVDPQQNAASAGSASYYAWSPKRRVRFISLDTAAQGGTQKGSAEGNIDDPQYQWLRGQLRAAKAAKQVVVMFGHHSPRRLIVKTADEALPACTGAVTTGCDADPRASTPVHLRADFVKLLNANPNVVAYFGAHSHLNGITPCASRCTGRGNWWAIESAASSDFPQQQRLAEIMDNRDGTLSLLATSVDHAGGTDLPAPTSDAAATAAFSIDQMAALSRTFAANDPRRYRAATGLPGDRNVELIVRNPFAGKGAGLCVAATNRVSGRTTDRAVLGHTRTANRRTYPKATLRAKTAPIDRFCLLGGTNARSGYPTAGLLAGLSRAERKRVAGRGVLAITSARTTKVQGIRVGSTVRTVSRRLRGEKRYALRGSTFYLAAASKARVLVQVRRGKVVALGLADKRLTSSAKGSSRFLSALF